MPRWVVVVPIAAGILWLASGCNLLFSLDGYAGVVTGAGGSDVGTDTSGADGATACPPSAIFCDDFERTDVKGPWDWSMLDDAGSALGILENTPSGRALESRIPAQETAGSAGLAKETSFSVKAMASMHTKLFLAAEPTNGGTHAGELVFHGSNYTSSVFPYLMVNGLRIGELHCTSTSTPPCAFDQSPPVRFDAGVWHDLVLTVDFATSPAKFTATLDGKEDVITWTSTKGVGPGTLEVHAGAFYTDEHHGDFDLKMDDVVVTGQ